MKDDAVALWTSADLSTITGGNLYLRHLIQALEEAGVPVRLMAAPPAGALPRVLLVDSLVLDRAAAWMAARRGDAAEPPARVVALMLFQPSAADPDRAALWRRAEAAVLSRADLVIAVGPTQGRALLGLLASPDRLRVISPGKDVPGPQPGAPSRGQRKCLRLLCVANWAPVKRIHHLVEALARLPDVVTLDLVGAVLDPDYAEHLRAAIVALGVERRVRVHGPLVGNDLARRYADADVFVLPSAYESYGVAAAEALAFGLPVVGCDVPGLRDLLGEGHGGILVPPDDVAALTSALERVTRDPDLRARLSHEAAARGAALPTWAQTRQALREALLPLLAGKVHRPVC
jgi:glycosyltransferase involved in cell wall biosynthesis